ncbi:MAG TPA: MlaD family protein [Acetobacteraceae bacterium]|nr:MlaD family protein [Acetobacteraceae bacterium]
MRLKDTAPALVGAFVLGGIALAVAAVLFFGGTELFGRSTRAVVYFEGSVGGLSPGAPVTFRGVQVGSVTGVALVLDVVHLTARIPVDLKLEPDRVRLVDHVAGSDSQTTVRRLIDAGLHAKLISQSFVTGQMQVELDLSPDTPSHFVGGNTGSIPEIPAMASDFEAFRQQITHAPITQTLEQAERTMAALETVVTHVDAELGPLLSRINRGLDSATETFDTGRTSIVRVQQDASGMLQQGTDLARDGREQLALRGAELARALQSADRALHSANSLFVSADSVVALRSRERDDLDAALRDLAGAISALRSFAQALDRNPSILLRGRGGP